MFDWIFQKTPCIVKNVNLFFITALLIWKSAAGQELNRLNLLNIHLWHILIDVFKGWKNSLRSINSVFFVTIFYLIFTQILVVSILDTIFGIATLTVGTGFGTSLTVASLFDSWISFLCSSKFGPCNFECKNPSVSLIFILLNTVFVN